MSIRLTRLLTNSCSSLGVRSRCNWTYCIPRRYVQEFPGMRMDNSSPKDYVIILPETLEDTSLNQMLKLPESGKPEVYFSKLNPEICFKGMCKALNEYENFITDINNDLKLPYESIQEVFHDVEKNLFPLDTAYNILMIMLNLEAEKYRYPEIAQLLKRYYQSRERRCMGNIMISLRRLAHGKEGGLSPNDMRMLKIYKISMRKRQGVRPLDENVQVAYLKNLTADMQQFTYNLYRADQNFSHTVDDPDILAAVAPEFDDCQDLHHKDRTPLQINPSTYHRFMRACPDRFVRQLLFQTYNKRCSPKALPKLNNLKILDNVRILRRRIADAWGYRSHLDYRLEDTMAKSKQRVMESLDAINRENSVKLSKNLDELYAYASDNSFSDPNRLGLREFDLDYWVNKYTHDIIIGVGESELKNFFPFKSVMQGLQDYFTNHFSIDFKTQARANNESRPNGMELIGISRKGQQLGTIIYSPYQRVNNRSDPYYARIRGRLPGSAHLPARFISTSFNLDESTGQANLSVHDVMLLFRCFSTVIQRLFYNYPYYELNTYGGLERDAVKLFPYLCEAHLLSDYKILQSCSIRDSSKPIDAELASRILRAAVYSRPFKTWYELYKAHLDLEFHSTMTSAKNLADEIYRQYSPFPRDPENFDYCAMQEFIVGPDDGLQYGDLWSKQLANHCLSQVRTPDDKIDDAKAKRLFDDLPDTLFNVENVSIEDRLNSLTGKRFEPSELGLGML